MTHHANEHGAATVTVTTHGGSDMRAAFTGLILGTLALLAIVVTIVMLTNRAFEGHGEAAPAATHAPAAPTGTPH